METHLLQDREIDRAIEALERGELVAVPTETVYGLAALAHNPEAVARIFEAKERPSFDPLIVHTHPIESVDDLIGRRIISPDALTEKQRRTLEKCAREAWPGPLTLVLPKHPDVPEIVTSGLSTVGVRIPSHPIFQAILRGVDAPIAAPSANRFGRISPTESAHVERELKGRVGWILDGGRCEVGIESSVAAVNPDGSLTLLRPGYWGFEELCELTGLPVHAATPDERLKGPGMTASHYAPRTPLQLTPYGSLPPASKSVATIAFQDPSATHTLSESASLVEAAHNLFRMLRLADESGARLICAEMLPDALVETTLGTAISDRLRRAAAEPMREVQQ